MNEKERRKSSYLKFLFSYVIVFLLPVMVMLIYFYPAVSRNMNESALIAGKHSLTLLKNSVDTQFRMISNYPSAIWMDPDITAKMLHDGSSYDHYLLQTELKKIAGTNPFLEKVLLFNRNDGLFFGTDTLYSSWEINNPGSAFFYDNWDKEAFMTYFLGLKKMDVREAEPVFMNQTLMNDIITISLPIPVGNPQAELVLIVLIREKNLFSDMGSLQGEEGEGSFFAVLDEKNRPIALSAHEAGLTEETITGLVESGIKENGQYLISSLDSNYYDMKYVIIQDKTKIQQGMNRVSRNTLVLFVLLLAGGAVLIWSFAHISYKPILLLKKKVSSREEQLKNYFFTQCMGGVFTEEEQVRENAEACSAVLFPWNCCIVCQGKDRENQKAEVTAILEKVTQKWLSMMGGGGKEKQFLCYRPEGLNKEYETLLVSAEEEGMLETWIKMFREVYQSETYSFYAGIGRSAAPPDIHTSYMLSVAAVEYAMTRKRPSAVSYDCIEVKRVENLNEIFECGRHLEIAVLRKNGAELRSCTGRMIKYLEGLRGAEETYKVVYRNMYNLLAREWNARGAKKEYIYTIADKKRLDYEVMEQTFSLLADQLSRMWEEGKPEKGKDLDIRDVFRYMEENAGDYNLSLQSAAEQFGMSYSNLSHYFKNSAGMNFSTWLERLRVEKAKEYLENSEDSLEKIAAEVGYSTANGLGRVFKKHCGMTPGEYRKSLRHSE
ncbi:helix-turn-helix domain-containing protein [Eisenbergiella sp.]|uniref:helix-turn-helix domain-containing protein n=1 Tax=Eisenbergiella sp. TaxID=1924109 RepID=UPI00207EEAD7|nr:AraC family transcriptional regulator [Eisenbergiella sp.]BDF47743.1 hypothetical protein CE91St56_48660 [Lachnospiraceae bacterium]GKH43818.1 hypothetical protein CE91St57_47920 [Lachnospiraceae bacterium]